jgi:nitrite reductase/ring-hydroxylating ferredoxin subunit
VTDPALTRRRALGLGAVAGLGLPVLTACGGGANGAQGTGSQHSGSSGGPQVLVAAKDVPVGGGVILADQNVVVTRPDKGTFEGFSATCTHQGCILASVAGGTINCGCHGSQFAITNGANVEGPSGSPAGSVPALPRVAITVKKGNVVKT